jgi:glycosyltransferase involved in cell wall biosynthesis
MTSDRRAPLFSVVVPTHDRARLLPRAVASVLAQTSGDFELLIVDDASSDDTAAVARSFDDPRVRYLPQEENRGVAAARNAGIAAAAGEWIAFLDDDDEYLPRFLEASREALERHRPAAGWCWCGVLEVDDSRGGAVVDRDLWSPRFDSLEAAHRGFLLGRRTGTGCGLVVRRACFDAVGGFDDTLRSGEDTELLVRLAREYPFTVVPEHLVRIHFHGGRRLRADRAAAAAGYRRILERNREVLEADPELWRSLLYKAAWLHYHAGDRAAARKLLWAGLRRSPVFLKGWLLVLLFETLGTRLGRRVHDRVSRSGRGLRSARPR